MSQQNRWSIDQGLEAAKQKCKKPLKPLETRKKYRQLYEWSHKQLNKFENLILKNDDSELTAKIVEQQKKVIVSMLLEISRLAKQQCNEKGSIIEEMLSYALKFMNQHQKYYQMITYTQIKRFRDIISEYQRDHIDRNHKLTQQIAILKQEKDHKWKNMFMLIKDNRVLRRQKAKLLKMVKQSIWKTKNLEEDLINLRSQNYKYKLVCSEEVPKLGLLKGYVKNQIMLINLDQKIKKYPGRARRLLKQQLNKSQTYQLKTLQSKINYIIQSLEQNNEVCQQLDDWEENIQPRRLFFNVSVQTYIEVDNVGVNTIVPIQPAKVYQTYRTQVKYQDLFQIKQRSKVIDMTIYPSFRKIFTENRKHNDRNTSFSKFRPHKNSINSITHHNRQSSDRFKNRNSNQLSNSRIKLLSNAFNLQISRPKIQKRVLISASDEREQQMQNSLSPHKLLKTRVKSLKKEKQNLLASALKKVVIIPQLYQLYYRPLLKNADKNQQEDPLDELEPILHLYQKLPVSARERRKGKFNRDNQFNFFQNSLFDKKGNNSANTDQANRQVQDAGNAPITEVVETLSNYSDQSVTYEFKQNFELRLPSRDPSKSNRSRNQRETGSFEKSKQVKMSKINNTRHRRQHTQNIQITKSRQKILQHQKQKPNLENKQMNQKMSKNKERLERIVFFAKNTVDDQKPTQLQVEYVRGVKKSKTYASNLNHQNTSMELKQPISSKKPLEALKHEKKKDMQDKIIVKDEHLISKLISAIFMRRKQIVQCPRSLRAFAQNFLIDQFDNKNPNYVNKARLQYKFFNAIKTYTTKSKQSIYICSLLEKLISHSRCQIFAEDMFVLFAKMLDQLHKFGVLSSLENAQYVPFQYGLKTLQFLCSVFLSPKQTADFLKQFEAKNGKKSLMNMIQSFIGLEQHLERIVFQSQLWQFWSNCSRWSVQNMTETQIRQILKVFNLIAVKNEIHFERISYYASKCFPLHRLCLYAHRFDWREVYYISSWIESKYTDLFGVYQFSPFQIKELFQELKQQLQSHKLPYMLQLTEILQTKSKIRNFSLTAHYNFIKLVRITVTLTQIEKLQIFPNNLQKIHWGYRRKVKAISQSLPIDLQ